MADLKISQLTSDTLGASDFVPIQRSTSNYKLNLKTSINAVLTEVFTGQSLTGSQDTTLLNLATTWNTTGTPTALKLNVTDIASNADSLLLDLQVGGSSKFNIKKSGIFDSYDASGSFRLYWSGSQVAQFLPTSWRMYGQDIWFDGDAFIGRKSAANLRHGAADAASPVAQYDSVQNVSTGTTDTAGAHRYFDGSQGTGTGAGGSIIFRTAAAGSSGSSQNALAAALTIASTGDISIANSKKLYFFNTNSSIWGDTNNTYIGAVGASNAWAFGAVSCLQNYWTAGPVVIGGNGAGSGNLNFAGMNLNLQAGGGTGNVSRADIFGTIYINGASGTAKGTSYEGFRSYILTANEPIFSIGGTTSSFPALKRNSAALECRLADDSGLAGFSADSITTTAQTNIASSGIISIKGYGKIDATSDGVWTFTDDAASNFGQLRFGGTTSGYPSIKRSGGILQGRLADDSGYCQIQGLLTTETTAVTETITPDKTLILYDASGTPYKVPCVAV